MNRGTGRTTAQLMESLIKYNQRVVPDVQHVDYCKLLIQKRGLPSRRIRIVTPGWVNNMQFKGLREPIVIDHSIWEMSTVITVKGFDEVILHNSRWGHERDIR